MSVKCDENGNVWAGCGDGLHVWSKSMCYLRGLSLIYRLGWTVDREDVRMFRQISADFLVF